LACNSLNKGTSSRIEKARGASTAFDRLENAFIRQHGFGEYAKWHLAIDERYAENTKRRYKFPYGDFKDVHRCGVLAVQSRATEHSYSEIENAAAQLRQMIEATRNSVH
jgi:hypothetical protein